jgi:hypothetical protein
LTESNTTGQLIFLPLLANLVVNFGWRAVSLIVALITLLIAPIAAFVLRNRPADFSSGLLCYFGSVPGGVHSIGIKANSACSVYA